LDNRPSNLKVRLYAPGTGLLCSLWSTIYYLGNYHTQLVAIAGFISCTHNCRFFNLNGVGYFTAKKGVGGNHNSINSLQDSVKITQNPAFLNKSSIIGKMQRFKYKSYRNNFTNILDVIEHMRGIENEAKNTDLENIIPFTYTYRIITQNVAAHFKKKYFQDDALMEKFDITFAHYYFNALKKYVETGETTPAWQILFKNAHHNRFSRLKFMALGVNAHVNNDLAMALNDVIKVSQYENEYNKINNIIFESLDEVISGLNEKNFIYKIMYGNTQSLYFPILRKIITQWRANAWKNYELLQSDTTHSAYIVQKAHLVARGISIIKM
jgi:hypothetical protein